VRVVSAVRTVNAVRTMEKARVFAIYRYLVYRLGHVTCRVFPGLRPK